MITESKEDFFAMSLLNPPCSASPILPCGGNHFVEQGKGEALGGKGLGCIR